MVWWGKSEGRLAMVKGCASKGESEMVGRRRYMCCPAAQVNATSWIRTCVRSSFRAVISARWPMARYAEPLGGREILL